MKALALIPASFFILALSLPLASLAENPGPAVRSGSSVAGTILDKTTQEQLGGVYLYFEELQKGVYSGPDGTFNLEGIAPGKYKVKLKYISYHEKEMTLKVKKSRKNHKIIQLDPINP